MAQQRPGGPPFDLAALPDELLECVASALVRTPSPLVLASDALRDALGLALSCRRMNGIVLEEARRKLAGAPPLPRVEGLRLSRPQVEAADVEQLRGWAAAAHIDRAPGKKRRWEKVEEPTVARLRALVAAECCTSLPWWQRALFRRMAFERRALVTPTEARNKWRLSEVELVELRSAHGARALRLPHVVAKAAAKFGSEAAFLDRSCKVRATKAGLVKARTTEAQVALRRWRRHERLEWGEHAHAFRAYTHMGRGPSPDYIAAELVTKRRKLRAQRVLAAARDDPSLLASAPLRWWWDVKVWDLARDLGRLDEAVKIARDLARTEAARRSQVDRAMAAEGTPTEAERAVRASLHSYLNPWWRPYPRWGFVLDTDKSVRTRVRIALTRWCESQSAEAADADAAAARRRAAEDAAQKRLAAAGWGMLRPFPSG
ncbi:MAG: hypothetical protein J3K34DRAFT_518907 [Monoraphidium minutum]|nr:MAG: hypothetical protein J3K34DRAFT_518907 [Monoraphidium minutum]